MLIWNVATVGMSMRETPKYSSCFEGKTYIIIYFKIISPIKKNKCGKGLKLRRYLPSHTATMCTNNRTNFLCSNPCVNFTFIESLWMHNSSSQNRNTRIRHKMFNSTDPAQLKLVVTFKCFLVFRWFYPKYTWQE